MAIFRPSQPKSSTPAASALAAIAQLAPSHLVGSMSIFHRIYVGSIQFDISESDLTLLFGQFGPVQSVSMMQDPVNRRHRGYGFVEFETPEAATLAQLYTDGTELGGRHIKVGRPNNFPADLPPGVPRPLPTRIYIGNVHELVQESELRLVCEAFGPVRHCHLAPNASTGKHKGYAYVEYEEEAGAEAALAGLQNFELAKKLLKVGRTVMGGPMPDGMESLLRMDESAAAGPRAKVPTAVLRAAQEINASLRAARPADPAQSTVMVLKNLEDYANMTESGAAAELEADVAEECARFGTIRQCKVHLDSSHQTVTVLVKFSTSKELCAALSVMHLRWFGGRQIVAEAFDEDLFNQYYSVRHSPPTK